MVVPRTRALHACRRWLTVLLPALALLAMGCNNNASPETQSSPEKRSPTQESPPPEARDDGSGREDPGEDPTGDDSSGNSGPGDDYSGDDAKGDDTPWPDDKSTPGEDPPPGDDADFDPAFTVQHDTISIAETIAVGDDRVSIDWRAATGLKEFTNNGVTATITMQGTFGLFSVESHTLAYEVTPFAVADGDTGTMVLSNGEAHIEITLLVGAINHSPLVPHVYLDMDEADLTTLYARSVSSDDRLPGMVRFHPTENGQPVEMRFRGNTTRHEPKKGYNIRFDDDQSFLFDSGDRINARAMWRDPSFVREHMAMWLFRAYDLPAPRTKYFQLFINDVFEGFYMHVERIDRRFSRERGLNRDATLVRDQFRSGRGPCVQSTTAFGDNNLSALSREDAIACLQDNFDDRRVDWDTVLDLILWVEGSQPGATFAQELDERVDVDSMIRFLGTHVLVGDVDALWGNDYWWFKDHEDPDSKWFFIPWDKNISQGSEWRPDDPDETGFAGANLLFPIEYDFGSFVKDNRLFAYLLETPSLRARLDDWLLAQLDSPTWREDFDAELAQALQSTTPYSSVSGLYTPEFHWNRDNRMHVYGTYEDMVEQVVQHRDLRSNFLRVLIEGSDGRHYQVEKVLANTHPSGQPLYLVDGHGFTLGRIIADSAIPAGTEIYLSAAEGSEDRLINHDWFFRASSAISGELSLYYRNNRREGEEATRHRDWYTGETTSIGRQPLIEMEVEGDWVELRGNTVAPAVNRIDMSVSIPDSQQDAVFRTN